MFAEERNCHFSYSGLVHSASFSFDLSVIFRRLWLKFQKIWKIAKIEITVEFALKLGTKREYPRNR